MKAVIQIDDEIVTPEQFIKLLKLSGEFTYLAERAIRKKVGVLSAKKRGILVSEDEIQQAADDFRRCLGLHRARDTEKWMDTLGIDEDDYEAFIAEHVYSRKMMNAIVTDDRIENYFHRNSPMFESVDVQHIVVEGEGKAKEIMARLSEDPGRFEELAKAHSLDGETSRIGGLLTGIRRGALPDEIDAEVFDAVEGDVLGPFELGDEDIYEIIRVLGKKAPELDRAVREQISATIYREWLEAQLKEYRIRM